VGTTGWTDQLEEVKKQCAEKNQSLFYSSNYSIGVNLFFKVNEYLARLMNTHSEYNVELEEIHHIHKLDAPSGTAITLANHIIEQIDSKDGWVNSTAENKNEVGIISKRLGEVPGTHTVTYRSEVDEISITHFAHNRKGFAMGAVMAAEWMKGKKGVFGMNDMLGEL
jgi:4-hydroxy-tetrahydrodipicolinate reductase